ncbi:BZ3501_MvSof-1269-A2-R1_Chr12-1g03406 [Microbotryum saponariae]|nr:BZ3501_MvSof-1269-A2-R1_Chr12-1g03406 [Microbotryum saponariae]
MSTPAANLGDFLRVLMAVQAVLLTEEVATEVGDVDEARGSTIFTTFPRELGPLFSFVAPPLLVDRLGIKSVTLDFLRAFRPTPLLGCSLVDCRRNSRHFLKSPPVPTRVDDVIPSDVACHEPTDAKRVIIKGKSHVVVKDGIEAWRVTRSMSAAAAMQVEVTKVDRGKGRGVAEEK